MCGLSAGAEVTNLCMEDAGASTGGVAIEYRGRVEMER
jgi:hypothetical protein